MIDIVLAEQMRRDGATYQEIANHFGVTRQAVHLNLKNHGRLRRRYDAIFNHCPYDGLRQFLQENKKVKIANLCNAVFGTCTETARSKTRRLIDGKKVSMTVNNIKRLEKYTGMNFDELFYDDSIKEEPGENNRDQWIRVTEQLPELTWKETEEGGIIERWGVSDDVLVLAKDADGGKYIVKGFYEDDTPVLGEKHTDWVFNTLEVIPESAKVTHWMPLPNPPEDETAKEEE